MVEISKGQEWILDMINNILIEVLTSIAENERLTIHTRQAESLAAMPVDEKTGKRISKRTGRCIGRPPIQFPENFEEYYQKWKAKEISSISAMKSMGLKSNSFYKLIHKYEDEHGIAQ